MQNLTNRQENEFEIRTHSLKVSSRECRQEVVLEKAVLRRQVEPQIGSEWHASFP